MSALADAIQAARGDADRVQSAELDSQRTGGVQSPEKPGTVGPGGINQVVPLKFFRHPRCSRGERPPVPRAGCGSSPQTCRRLDIGRIRCGALQTKQPRATTATDNTIENAYYRVVLDPASGAVRGIFDKELNRELVDASSPYRFNQYVLATGEAGVRCSRGPVYRRGCGSEAAITDANRRQARLGNPDAVRESCAAAIFRRAHAEHCHGDHSLRRREEDRIHQSRAAHAGGRGVWRYFAFPFAIERPQFRYEIQNGVVDPEKDVLPGSGQGVVPGTALGHGPGRRRFGGNRACGRVR